MGEEEGTARAVIDWLLKEVVKEACKEWIMEAVEEGME